MDTRTSIFIVCLMAFVFAWGFNTSSLGLCCMGIVVEATKGSAATTCFEFWLNRYQSLIAGLLSLGAAFIAAFLVWRQLDGMRAANEISRKAQSISQYDAVTKRFHAINGSKDLHKTIADLIHDINYFIQCLSHEVADRHFWSEVIETRSKIDALQTKIKIIESGLTQGISFGEQIDPLKVLLEKIDYLIWEFVSDFEDQPANNRSVHTKRTIVKFSRDFEVFGKEFTQAAANFVFAKAAELREIEALMRKLENTMMS